jgi:hypothetical protein
MTILLPRRRWLVVIFVVREFCPSCPLELFAVGVCQLDRCRDDLGSTVAERQESAMRALTVMEKKINAKFRKHMEKHGHEASIQFDHEHKKLTARVRFCNSRSGAVLPRISCPLYQVTPNAAKLHRPASQALEPGTVSTLSGGEKAYSTLVVLS